jgi:hypothetical protein
VYSLSGDSYFAFQDSRFESSTTFITGSGDDTFYTDNVWFSSRFHAGTQSGTDLIVLRDSYFGGRTTLFTSNGEDHLAVLGTNQFEKTVRASGGPKSDSWYIDPLTRFRRKPLLTSFEHENISELGALIDKAMRELADVGLDLLLT